MWDLILSDAKRWKEKNECMKIVGGGRIRLIINALFVINQSLAYLFWFRVLSSKPNFFLYCIAKYKYRSISKHYGLQISPQTKIGRGLYIFHGIGIIINRNAVIGENCSISQFTTIGGWNGKAATIGNNVYIGPGVSTVGGVKIGNDVKIGAGTIVVNDVPDGATTVGNPNRIISK